MIAPDRDCVGRELRPHSSQLPVGFGGRNGCYGRRFTSFDAGQEFGRRRNLVFVRSIQYRYHVRSRHAGRSAAFVGLRGWDSHCLGGLSDRTHGLPANPVDGRNARLGRVLARHRVQLAPALPKKFSPDTDSLVRYFSQVKVETYWMLSKVSPYLVPVFSSKTIAANHSGLGNSLPSGRMFVSADLASYDFASSGSMKN
jgi:hypothetical protein